MSEERIRQIVRQFPENGLKQVLTSPGNLRELLAVGRTVVLPRLDFAGMKVEPTTFVTAEYRHVSSDLVLTLALRPTKKGGARRQRLTVTVLIELQTQPDRLMLLRVLDYLVQIWKQQVKRHGERHRSLANVKLTPVLPVVLHTGSYGWERLGRLVDLMDDAEDFAQLTPAFAPVFVSLPDVSEAEFARGGAFGQVLALLKARKAQRGTFAQRLEQTVTRLEELKGAERQRRRELLSYVEALVYHSRGVEERELLRGRVDAALREDVDRLEVDMVRRTMADVDREEAALAAKKETLLDLLRVRWGALPAETAQVIQATQDVKQLAEWLRGVITAADLDAVGITSRG